MCTPSWHTKVFTTSSHSFATEAENIWHMDSGTEHNLNLALGESHASSEPLEAA
jgi:hypothetical protein